MMKRLSMCLFVLASSACGGTVEPPVSNLSSFRVSISAPEIVEGGELWDVPTSPMQVQIDIQAVGRNGDEIDDWSGDVEIKIRPGRMTGENRVRVENGKAEGVTVSFTAAWGDARVWAEELVSVDAPGSYALGVSERLPFRLPYVADVQQPGTVEYGDPSCFGPWGFIEDCANLAGDFVRIAGIDHGRRLMVTNVTTDGFYATDIDAPAGSWNSVFAFNFSRPQVEVGDMLGYLSGNVAEFIGFTELNYPVWDARSGGHELPPRTDIAAALCGSGASSGAERNAFLERWESSPVEIPDAVMALDLWNDETYFEFAQWPVRVPSCQDAEFTLISLYEAPQFDPICWKALHEAELAAGREAPAMGSIRGHLRHIGPAEPEWVLDLEGVWSFSPEVRNSTCWDAAKRRIASGPRLTDDFHYRPFPTCSGLPWDVDEHEDEE